MMRRISASISSWKISRCSMVRVSASVLVIGHGGPPGQAVEVLAHRGDGAVDARGVDVEVGHEAQAVEAGGEHAARLQVLDQAGGAVACDVDEDHVGLRRLDRQPGQPAQPLGEPRAQRVVVGQALDVVVERVQRRRGQHAGLAHAAAEHLAPAVRAAR